MDNKKVETWADYMVENFCEKPKEQEQNGGVSDEDIDKIADTVIKKLSGISVQNEPDSTEEPDNPNDNDNEGE